MAKKVSRWLVFWSVFTFSTFSLFHFSTLSESFIFSPPISLVGVSLEYERILSNWLKCLYVGSSVSRAMGRGVHT